MKNHRHFEVAVIGGGIYGAAIAFHLCRQGIKTLLTEENTIAGKGATAYSGGIVRVYDPDPVLAAFSLAGTEAFTHWTQLGYPGPSPYRNTGCLYRIAPDHHSSARQSVEVLQKEGYTGELLTGPSLPARFPALCLNSGDLAIWEPASGYGDPRMAARALAAASRESGGTLYEWCKVTAFRKSGNHWQLTLPLGTITARILVITCGAYTSLLLPDLPLVTRSISLLHFAGGGNGFQLGYSVVDEMTGTYIRPMENGGFYGGSGFSEEQPLPAALTDHTDEEKMDALQRVQQLVHSPYRGIPLYAIRGFDAYTPGKRPIACFLPGYEDLFLATGFSGRGFKFVLPLTNLIAGKIVAQLGECRPAGINEPGLQTLFNAFAL